MKLKKDELYQIEWLDHASDAKWLSEEEIEKWIKDNKPCISKGRFCFETNDVVVLYLDKVDDMFGCTTMIYKKNIIGTKKI